MKYPGGKGRTFQQIINLMPPHTVYVETHLGGGAVLRHKQRAQLDIAIEKDPMVAVRTAMVLPQGVRLIRGDAHRFLRHFRAPPSTLIYADPPYLPESRRATRVYRYDYTRLDHIRLLELLRPLNCMVMISGYHSSLYEDALSDWNRESFLAKTHADVREENVWFNFPRPAVLHDARFLGANFRDRQTTKRRFERLTQRIDRLSSPEQHVLLNWLGEKIETQKREHVADNS